MEYKTEFRYDKENNIVYEVDKVQMRFRIINRHIPSEWEMFEDEQSTTN